MASCPPLFPDHALSSPGSSHQWLQPGLLMGLLWLLWYEIKAGKARTTERLDEMEAKQHQDMSALKAKLKADNRALAKGLDRFLETLLTTKPQV